MRIATWNINSVRLRLNKVIEFWQEFQPDILCLQETKVSDSEFPKAKLEQLDNVQVVYRGEKSYNGVAIISKLPFNDKFCLNLINEEARHIAISNSGWEIHNFYVPAGGDIPDRDSNPKFAHKLDYIKDIDNWFLNNRQNFDKNLILTGDLNIAPLEHDVWSSKQLNSVISHTPIERELLTQMRDNFSWIDAPREFVSANKKLYSWWSYRNRDYKRSNRGRRLDHIWVDSSLYDKLDNYFIHTESRGFTKPSDHVPVIVDVYL